MTMSWKKMKLISEHWGDNRKAEIYDNGECFVVRLIEKENILEDREMVTNGTIHSMRYAEDAAENWCLGYMA